MESGKLNLLQEFADKLSALVKTYQDTIEKNAGLSENTGIRARMKEIQDRINSLKDEMKQDDENTRSV